MTAHHFCASTAKPLTSLPVLPVYSVFPVLRKGDPSGCLADRGDREDREDGAALRFKALRPEPARPACALPHSGPCSILRPATRLPLHLRYWTRVGTGGRRIIKQKTRGLARRS